MSNNEKIRKKKEGRKATNWGQIKKKKKPRIVHEHTCVAGGALTLFVRIHPGLELNSGSTFVDEKGASWPLRVDESFI